MVDKSERKELSSEVRATLASGNVRALPNLFQDKDQARQLLKHCELALWTDASTDQRRVGKGKQNANSVGKNLVKLQKSKRAIGKEGKGLRQEVGRWNAKPPHVYGFPSGIARSLGEGLQRCMKNAEDQGLNNIHYNTQN